MRSPQKRVVFYPVIINGLIEERVGVFDVFFNAEGLPDRAVMPRFVGYETTMQLVNFWDAVQDAIIELENLHCNGTVNLDADEWDGTLTFYNTSMLQGDGALVTKPILR